MTKLTSRRKRVFNAPFKKRNLNLTIASLLAASLSAPIYAAEESSDAPEDDTATKVIITGSRLARDPNLASTSPVQSLDADDIKASGEFSIADVVNDVPALFSSVTGEGSKDNGGFSDGANVLNLRGLGANRTLVLVDGRRHVAGVSGQQAVDVGSIPMKLIERVEVLSGGASAIYGADAVTGVVNFILKDDFEGFEVDYQFGQSSEGDGQQNTLSAIWGTPFDSGKGNIAIAVDYRKDEGLRASERANGRQIGSARDWLNPDLRFQQGDIDPNTMPNFAQYYNYGNTGLFRFGLPIPNQADFIADYFAEFGMNPTLTQAELDLIARAANAPQRAILPERTFPFTSGYGYIIPGNPFTFAGFDPLTNIDLDGNGRPDCLDSFTGYNSVFGAASFGVVGGCWNVNADGTYRPIRDGLVADDFQGFGGDSFNTIIQNDEYIILPDEKLTFNAIGSYDISDLSTAFFEFKYVTQETEDENQPTSFWDLLFGAPDNPFLPAFIQPVAQATGGVAITIDPIGIGSGRQTTERDTLRLVTGIEGTFDNGFDYEASINYGKYEEEIIGRNAIINDRFFAAIDAVTDPATGNPACRIEVDPGAPALTTPFDIPTYDPGYFSFTPGAGQCVPLNIWAGRTGITQEAIDWVTADSVSETELSQLVISGHIVGDTGDWFELPHGVIDFVAGAEYREEESKALFDDLQRGVIPANSVFPAGTNIADVSANSSLVFRPALNVENEVGKFDVTEVFIEASLPLLRDVPGAQELTLEVAARFADYSTLGSATTWKTNLFYQPYEDLSIRATLSEAVRAPNITELFGPPLGTTFRPNDPCDAAQIAAVATEDPTLAAQTQANCETYFAGIGIDPTDGSGNYVFADPLSASFGGIAGGNPDLDVETANTQTLGFIYQPEFAEGLSITWDYWEIEIDDAIQAVSAQDIVNSCFIGPSLNQEFCQFLSRNDDPNSLQAGGFNFIRQTLINFAKVETAGFDFSIGYDFNIDEHRFNAKVQGTRVHKIDQFTNPTDLSVINPELKEVNRPELAGNIFFTWSWEDLVVGTQSQYMDEQLLRFVEIEQQFLYGDSVMQDEFWIHDLSASYAVDEQLEIYGGIKNLTDEEPFITDYSFPVSPRGRFIFLGVNFKL
ncbi:TonB-dependent receptor [Aliikangiella marina]|uniref:TonB-dependent receptor n=1 Tax=Aliikangiella marina TaxID=1712262 RepID=A0A545T2Y9_9GAMM|nr:TonB-dependent receptor [Aliikangiella marina]TQV71583.1 TonB-dependent receptor [Aliikangiella marina]